MEKEIIFYTKPRCQKCNILKTLMDKKNINYSVVDISQDLLAFEMLNNKNIMSLPVVYIDNDYISDFNKLTEIFK